VSVICKTPIASGGDIPLPMLTQLRAHLNDRLFWNTYLLVIMRVFGAGTGLLFWAWVARLMPPAEVGLASGAVSAASLMGGLAQLGLGYGLVRHLPAQDDPSPLINFSLLLSSLVGLALTVIFLGTLPWWTPVLRPLRADLRMILLIVLLVITTALTQLMHWVFMAARRASFSLWKMTIQSIAALALLPIFRPFMPGYVAAIAAYTLSTVIGLIPSFWPFLIQAHPRYHFFSTWRPLNPLSFAGYSLANYTADQLQRAPDTVLPLLILSALGPSAGAYFFVVWTFGRSLPAWAGSLAESMFAEASHAPGMTTLFARRSVLGGLALSGGLALAAIVLGGPVLMLYGSEYLQNGFGLLIAVALATAPTVLLYSYVNIWRVRNQLRAVLMVTAIGVGLGIVFSLLGAHWAGLIGTGLGWLASQLLVALGLMIWLRNYWRPEASEP
jgi:O-antigen/teichoic acid export membrane protein